MTLQYPTKYTFSEDDCRDKFSWIASEQKDRGADVWRYLTLEMEQISARDFFDKTAPSDLPRYAKSLHWLAGELGVDIPRRDEIRARITLWRNAFGLEPKDNKARRVAAMLELRSLDADQHHPEFWEMLPDDLRDAVEDAAA